MNKLNRLFIIKNATHLEVLKIFLNLNGESVNYIILTLDRLSGNEKLIQTLKYDESLRLLKVFILKSQSGYKEYFTVFNNIFEARILHKYANLFDEVIISNYKTWFQHFLLNKFNTNKIILLSDGLGLLEVPIMREKGKNLPFERLPFGGNKMISNYLLNLKPIDNLHYFSQVKMKIGDDDSIEIFKYPRGGKREVSLDKVYFIGSPLVELKYIDQSNYVSSLKQISNKYKSKRITYFSHRKEQDYNLESYKFLGKVNKNTKPFEKLLEEEETLPSVIISHISSVLVNLSPIYPEIQFKYIPITLDGIKDPIFLKRYKTALEGFENIKEDNFKAW